MAKTLAADLPTPAAPSCGAAIEGATTAANAPLPAPGQPVLRRNFILHVANGALIAFADALTGPALVLTSFVIQLTSSNVLIGLISPMRDAGWFLPQLFISSRVERARYKTHFYRAVAVARVLAWAVLVACVFTISDTTVLLVVFFACIALSSVLSGFAGLPYLLVTTKVIPANRRGLLFGLRQSLGGALGVAAGGALALMLSGRLGVAFPHNYALVFAVATAVYIGGYAAFSAIREQPDDVPARTTPMRAQLRRAWTIAQADRQYQRFLLMRIGAMVGAVCIPFLTVYAKRVLGVSDSFIGTLVAVTLASSLLSNAVWARLSDRRGNRLVLLITLSMGVAFCALTAVEVSLTFEARAAEMLLVLAFAISGAMSAGMGLASGPLLMELAAADRQSLYFGLSNTILGIVLICTGLVGLVVDRLGYTALFALCGLSFLFALGMAWRIREPRAGIAT